MFEVASVSLQKCVSNQAIRRLMDQTNALLGTRVPKVRLPYQGDQPLDTQDIARLGKALTDQVGT